MLSSTNKVVARNAFHLGVAQVASTTLGILQTAILGRTLGPADYGILYAAGIAAAFIYVIVDWGQSTCLVRELARERTDAPNLIASALLLRLALVILATSVAFLILLALGISQQIMSLTLLTVAVAIPTVVYAPFGYAFRGRDRMDCDGIALIFGKAITVASTAIASILGGGLATVILMQGIGNVGVLAVGIFFAVSLTIRVATPDMATLRELIRSGGAFTIFSLVLATQPAIETLLLSAFAGAAIVGSFGASRAIVGLAAAPAMIISAAAFPGISRAAQSPINLRQILESTSRVLFIVAAFSSSCLYLFADHMVAILYGHGRFELTAPILRISAAFLPMNFFAFFLASTMSTLGHNNALATISVVRIGVASMMGWLFIGYWQTLTGNGAVAMVAIAGVVEIPAVITCMIILSKEVIGAPILLSALRAHVVALGTVALFWWLPPLSLPVQIPLFVAVFAIVAMAVKLLAPNDIRLVMGLIRAKWSAARQTNGTA